MEWPPHLQSSPQIKWTYLTRSKMDQDAATSFVRLTAYLNPNLRIGSLKKTP
ncbi:MAG: hypothetical protein ACJAUP_001610 [Cellvibrionaceae bacterium]|jgi:hypothetical protein